MDLAEDGACFFAAATGATLLKLREFENECLSSGRIQRIHSVSDLGRIADDFQRLSARKLAAAELLLGNGMTDEAIGLAYFAMEHKANELLARVGWKSKSHVCTIAALSRLLDRKDLADALSMAYADRQTFDYTADPALLRSAATMADFLAAARTFRQKVEEALSQLK